MWRVVEDINHITGRKVWVVEKKSGFFIKKWSRDYKVGRSNIPSPIKSLGKDTALKRMEILSSGIVLESTEILKS
tara:strand:+ start:671 stop:895 length:225 start_codon:yes stop_codon:yes gene_type:complete